MTTQTQFCTNLINEFFKPSGPILLKSQLSIDNNRPLLNAFLTQNFNINSVGKVEIKLQGLNIKLGKNLFRQDCFEFNCFEEEGITTYIQNVSNICLVNNNTFLTKQQRESQNVSCHLNINNQPTFFIRGTPDANNAIYLADIGIINTTSGVFSIIDKNIPFYFKDELDSLSALSIKNIPKGIKCARLKKVTKTSVEDIGTIFGELDNQFYLPHTTLKKDRKFTAQEQSINLENLSINLILLSSFKEFEFKPNQVIYRDFNFSAPEIENTLVQSSNNLINLILTESFIQKGSIPLNISSFLNNQNQYNSNADTSYLNKVKDCFENNCFDKNCFETITNNNLIDRSIDNRAIAWAIQYLSAYTVSYNTDLSKNIIQLVTYLLNQKDKNTKLFYKGWDQKLNTQNCTELTDEEINSFNTEDNIDFCQEELDDIDDSIFYYSNSLTINKEILTSTNISIFIALLKTFEITQDYNYLIEADNLYNAINKYLLNNNNLLKHSLAINDTSLESVTYQLLFNLALEKYDLTQNIIDFLNIRLSALPIQTNEQVFVGSSIVTVASNIVETNPLDILTSDDDLNLFTPTSIDKIETVEDIFKYNYLITSNLLLLNNKLNIPFINTIKNKLNVIQQKVEDSRENSSLIFAASCLIENNSLLTIDNSKINSLFVFNNYQLQKSLQLNKLLINTPKEYNWFNTNKLNRNSTIGNIYYAIAQTLAKNAVEYETLKQNISLDNSYGVILNKKAEEYGLKRFTRESDSLLRNRIKSEIYKRGINKSIIETRLLDYNSPVNITDNYKSVLSFEEFNSIYNNNWGEGYLQGTTNSSTNISTFNFNQPVEQDIYDEINKLKPLGTKVHIRENLTFFISNNSTLINIQQDDNIII